MLVLHIMISCPAIICCLCIPSPLSPPNPCMGNQSLFKLVGPSLKSILRAPQKSKGVPTSSDEMCLFCLATEEAASAIDPGAAGGVPHSPELCQRQEGRGLVAGGVPQSVHQASSVRASFSVNDVKHCTCKGLSLTPLATLLPASRS